MQDGKWQPSTCFLLLSIAQVFAWAAAGADAPAATEASRLVVAILPFTNATGDSALQHWSDAFAEMLERLAWADRVELVHWTHTRRALTNAGWQAHGEIKTNLVERVAHELETDAIVWGQYS